MNQQTSQAIRVCEVDELGDGEAIRVPREDTGAADAIAVFNDDGTYYALGDTCPHASASLSEGWVEDGEVECPLHGSRFCLRTGEVAEPPANRDARTYPVEVRDGAVWLTVAPEAG